MNISLKHCNMFFILTMLITSVSFGQHYSSPNMVIGQPFIKSYTPKDYNASRINWCIIQDKRGVVYAGNENGIIEYDGNTWRKIDVPNSDAVRSMDIDENGTIFVCAAADFGFLERNSQGLLKYKSLLPFLSEEYRDFGEIWDVATSSHGIYFKTPDQIFRWDGNQMFVWDSVYAFRLYNIDDIIYSRNQGTGLMYIEGDSIKLMKDGNFFYDTGVYNLLPFRDSTNTEKILITTNKDGIFIHDGIKNYPLKTEADSYLSQNQIYNACITSEGNIALCSQRGGVIILDNRGKLLRTFAKNSGLPTDVVYDIWPDPMGGLWLATVSGIVYMELTSPFSIITKSGLIEDQANSVLRFNGNIYITNELGIFSYSNEKNLFKLIKGSNQSANMLFNANGTLLAATNDGIAIINKDRIDGIIDEYANVFIKSKAFKNRFYAGIENGYAVIEQNKNNNFIVTYTKFFESGINLLAEDKYGDLWIDGYFSGIYHVTGELSELSTGSDKNIQYKYFSVKDDLPGLNKGIYNVKDKIILATDNGTFTYNEHSNSFLRDSTLGKIFYDSTLTITSIIEDQNNDLWILADSMGRKDLGKAILQNDGKYKWESNSEFRRLNLNSIVSIYPEFSADYGKEVMWICTDESLIFYNPIYHNNIGQNFRALIRKVKVNKDSLIYGGSGHFDKFVENLELPFSKNNIEFEYTATSYDKSEANEYQYFLKGNDEVWSQWSTTTIKEYTNLPYGDYSFQFRAKNIYGKISNGEEFNFAVLPPWYFTWWAFLFYSFSIISGIFVTDRIMRRKIINRERNKAKLVDAEHRAETAELQAKAAEAQAKVIQAENDRKTKELEEARQLQLSMLPKNIPRVENLDIAVYMKTATEVGGDYYDFSFTDDGTLNVSIGDATGHGMQAGTLVTIIKGLFTSEASNREILAFFKDASRTIKEINLGRLMMAFSLLKINVNRLQYSGAGMPPMYIYRKNFNTVDEIDMQGMPLGAIRNFKYNLFETELVTGDCILLLSDGYPELANSNDEQIGYERLQNQFMEVANKKPEEVVEYFKDCGSKWVNGKDPDDDVTFVVIKIK